MKSKAFFIIFKAVSVKQITHFLEGESPTLNNLTKEAVVQRCSAKNIFLEIFVKFTGKQLCQSLFFNKVAGLRTPLLQNTSGRVLPPIY